MGRNSRFFLTPQQAARALPSIYDAITPDFDRTRHGAWPEMEPFFEAIPQGTTLLDLGCGNGRFIPYFLKRGAEVIGVDPAEKLRAVAAKKFPQASFRNGDLTHIPVELQSCDEVWAIATFHHLSSVTERKQALQEIRRVLKKSGHLVLSVWNVLHLERYAQKRREAFWRSFFLPWWSQKDLLIPWGTTGLQRYYYAFERTELLELVEDSGFILQAESSSAENLCFRFRCSAV